MVFRENSLGNIIPALNLEGDYNNVWTTLKYFCKIWYPQIYIQNIKQMEICTLDFCGGSDGKESACNAGDTGLTPRLGRSLGEGNGNPLQYSCLGKPMDRGAWWATVHGVAKSRT